MCVDYLFHGTKLLYGEIHIINYTILITYELLHIVCIEKLPNWYCPRLGLAHCNLHILCSHPVQAKNRACLEKMMILT